MAQTYEYIGKVEEVLPVQTFTSGFRKRDLVVGNEYSSKYENPVKFTFKKDKCDLLDGIMKGQSVKVRFSVEGRKWDGPKGTQYFVDLNAFAIEANAAGGSNGRAAASVPPPATPTPSSASYDDVADDMPF